MEVVEEVAMVAVELVQVDMVVELLDMAVEVEKEAELVVPVGMEELVDMEVVVVAVVAELVQVDMVVELLDMVVEVVKEAELVVLVVLVGMEKPVDMEVVVEVVVEEQVQEDMVVEGHMQVDMEVEKELEGVLVVQAVMVVVVEVVLVVEVLVYMVQEVLMQKDMEKVLEPEVVRVVVAIILKSTLSPLQFTNSINIVTTSTKRNKCNLVTKTKTLKDIARNFGIEMDGLKSCII
ncbi:hypothetical protein J1N35_016268 [Gossypium stocksii]|uniref:Uncharacterized protein n=1 Tax=Gossypium stocksii TaxID=47602 RepID=A0A9D3VJU7_9ROSI|nr:hypothetical protein J1N35_016268 [Gossypium stocksii]